MKKEIFLILFFQVVFLRGQDVVKLMNDNVEYSLSGNFVRIYKDASKLEQPREVTQQKFDLTYIDYEKNPDWRTSAFWFKVKIRNTSSRSMWLLEVPDFHIEEVEFYNIGKDSIQKIGFSRKFDNRFYEHKNAVFELEIPEGEERAYLVKMASSESFGSVIKIRAVNFFVYYAVHEYFLLGLYYGFLILIAFYNLFIFRSIKDKANLFYFFYVLSVGLRSFQEDGLGFQYIWPDYPELNIFFRNTASLILLIAFAAYSAVFLEIRTRNYFYFKVLLGSVAAYLVFYLVSLVAGSAPYIQVVYLLPFAVIYGISVLFFRQGYKAARFFILGYSLLIVSLMVYYFRSIGLANTNNILLTVLSVYCLNIGFVIEAFVFSIALADKIKLFKRELDKAQEDMINQLKVNEELKDKVNLELEIKVLQRTEELDRKSNLLVEANLKLEKQAEQINSMNKLLDLENFKLKSNVQDINKDRGLLKALSFEEFLTAFPNDVSCYRFIEELKWGDGYKCRKCENEKYLKGKDVFNRKCTKCTYNESIKANTIFHDIKFPIEKAFQLIYLTLVSEKDVSTYDLAKRLDLRQKTCWGFRKRIIERLERQKISYKDILEKGWSILILDER